MQIVFDATSLGYWGSFNPDTLKKGSMLGGTEINIIQMAKAFSIMGHDVIVFRPSELKERQEFDNVSYMPSDSFLPYVTAYEDIDVMITATSGMRSVYCNSEINAKLKVDYASCPHVYMQPGYEEKTDMFLYMSEFQKHYILKSGINPEKLFKFKFGYDTGNIKIKSFKERKNRIIYASSPDRGLHHFIGVFKKMKESIPDLEGHVFYEVNSWLANSRYSMFVPGVIAAKVLKDINTPGLVFRGAISYSDLMNEYSDALALVYPCQCIQPSEAFARVPLELSACGTPVYLSNADCLEEIHGDACRIIDSYDYNLWADTVNKDITDENRWNAQSNKQLEYYKDYTWDKTLKDVEKEFLRRIII